MTDTDFGYSKERYKTIQLPRWNPKYKLLRPYNGFTGIERLRSWQLTMWAIKAGILRAPYKCSISGVVGDRPGVIQYHNENYYDPLAPHPIHSDLHRTLHRRFVDPDRWQRVISLHAPKRLSVWYLDLPLDEEPDLAAALRAEGMNTHKMVDVFMKNLPSGAPKPFGRLHVREDFDLHGNAINPPL